MIIDFFRYSNKTLYVLGKEAVNKVMIDGMQLFLKEDNTLNTYLRKITDMNSMEVSRSTSPGWGAGGGVLAAPGWGDIRDSTTHFYDTNTSIQKIELIPKISIDLIFCV